MRGRRRCEKHNCDRHRRRRAAHLIAFSFARNSLIAWNGVGQLGDPLSAFACDPGKLQLSPLRYPGFPVQLGDFGKLRAAFRKAACVTSGGPAMQEIRVRSS